MSYQTPDFSHEQITNCLINQSNFHLPVCNYVSLPCKQQAWWRKSNSSEQIFSSPISMLLIAYFNTCWFLKLYRFYCASAVDNRTRLNFHGERRIWDGGLIKQKIKGNSALYIYTDEVLQLICRCIVVRGLMGACGQPGYVFRDFCFKQGIDFIIFCLNQGIDFINFCLKQGIFLNSFVIANGWNKKEFQYLLLSYTACGFGLNVLNRVSKMGILS